MSRLLEHIGGPAVVILVGALISTAGALWASVEQARSERELRAKSDEIADLNRSIAASVTGGDSFCYLDLDPYSATSALLVLTHNGKFPLYDISIRIVDLQKFELVKNIHTLESIKQAEVILNAGNLGPTQSRLFGEWPLPLTDRHDLNIFISARNGFITELLRHRRINGKWQSAVKVTRDGDNTLLFERIDPDFPRDEKGKIHYCPVKPQTNSTGWDR